MPVLRRILPIAALAAAAALVLAGCTGAPSPASSTDPSSTPSAATITDDQICDTPGGAVVDAVSVTGDLGAAPTVHFTAPLTLDTTQRSVLIDGGTTVEPGATIEVAYTLLNGATGAVLDSGGYGAGATLSNFTVSVNALRPGFARTLGCVGPGSRVVGVIPPAEGFGGDATDSGVGSSDAIVFVVDVINEVKPTPWAVAWTTDLPTITEAGGVPTLTLPASAPKTDVEVAVLKQGDGAVVGPSASVTVDYLGMKWEDGAVFDESYSSSPATFSVTGVVPGFADALIGQKVGSRILVTMPPDQGYGAAGTSSSPLAGFTLVFLVDIKAISG